jgi:hypothetical protein
MPDYSNLNPSRLKPGLVTPGGDLKPGLVTEHYTGGIPSAANQVKPSLLDADGNLKPGLLLDGKLKPSLVKSNSKIRGEVTASSLSVTEGDEVTYTFENTSIEGHVEVSSLSVTDGDEVTREFIFDMYSIQWFNDEGDLDGETAATLVRNETIGALRPRVRVTNETTEESEVFDSPVVAVAPIVDDTLILTDLLNAQGSWVDNDSGGWVWNGAMTGNSLLDEKSAYLAVADLLTPDVVRVRAYLSATDIANDVFPTCRLLALYNQSVSAASRCVGHGGLGAAGAVHQVSSGTLYNINQHFADSAFAIKSVEHELMFEVVGRKTADESTARLYDISNGYARVIAEVTKSGASIGRSLAAQIAAYSTTGIEKITVHDADVAWSSQSIDYDDAAIYWVPQATRDTGTYRDARTSTKLCSFVTNSNKIAVVLRNTNVGQYGVQLGWSIDDGESVKCGYVFYAGSGNDFVIGDNFGSSNKTVHIYYDSIPGGATQQPRFSSDSGCYVGITGFKIDSAATLGTYTPRTKLMYTWTDSRGARDVTTGVPGGGHAAHAFTARLGELLDAEVAQIGFEWQGINYAHISTAPNGEDSWDFYSSGNSRLSGGLMPIDPDFVYVSWGRNDFALASVGNSTYQTALSNTLAAMRAAMPTAVIFVEVPLEGMYRAQVVAAVAAQSDSDIRVIDLGDDGAELLTNGLYNDDTIHVNAVGALRQATLIKAIIDAE